MLSYSLQDFHAKQRPLSTGPGSVLESNMSQMVLISLTKLQALLGPNFHTPSSRKSS